MTSIKMLSEKELRVDEFATTTRSRFAEVFGYEESVTVDPATLWQLIASDATAPEEQHRNA
jgi:lipoate-protein ligase A